MDKNYIVHYRKIKYPRIEFKNGKLEFILPYGENPERIFEKHKEWIIKKKKFIEEIKQDNDLEIINRNPSEFKDLLNQIIDKYSKDLNVKVNRIFIRKMRTKWGSLSSKNNITLNRFMMNLPEYLIEYIIYHELAHLIERRHNKKFREIIEKRFKNYEKIEKKLFAYFFKFFSE